MSDLKRKSESQLKVLAGEMGLDLDVESMNKTQLIEAIEAASVPVEEPVEEAPAEEAPAPKAKKYRIIIANQDGVENTPFVKVGVNGRVWQINREQEAVVPEEVMEVLRNAVVEMPPLPDQPPRTVRRFPVTVLEVI